MGRSYEIMPKRASSKPVVVYATLALGLAVVAAAVAAPDAKPRSAAPGAKAGAADHAPGSGDPKVAAGGTKPPARQFTTETYRGKVVWLDEALARLYGIAGEPDAAHTAVALEMADGQLLPIVADTRGRAFAVDERLRNVEVELLARRYAGVPMIQVIQLYFVKPDGRYLVDYWCDICAIPMAILKACECCQGPTRLRERKVAADGRLEE